MSDGKRSAGAFSTSVGRYAGQDPVDDAQPRPAVGKGKAKSGSTRRQQCNVYLRPDEWAAVQLAAEESGQSASTFVRSIVLQHLRRARRL